MKTKCLRAFVSVLLYSVMSVVSVCKAYAEADERQADLVKNAGFEDMTLKPWEWYLENGSDSIGQIDAEIRYSGTASFRMSRASPAKPNVYGALRQIIRNVQPNTNYLVSAWVKGEEADRCVMILGRKWAVRQYAPTGTTDWTQLTKRYTTGPEETDIQVVFIADGMTKAFWVDDVSVRPADSVQSQATVFKTSLSEDIPAEAGYYPLYGMPVESAPRLKLQSANAPGLTAEVRMAGGDALFLSIEVSTAFRGNAGAGEQMWRGDSVQIGIDAGNSASGTQQANVAFELGFSVPDDGDVAGFAWNGTFDFTSIKAHGKKTDSGFRIDLVIPWRSISLDTKALPESFGLNIVVNNGDLRNHRVAFEWMPGLMKNKDFSQFARIMIVPPSQSFAALTKIDRRQYNRDDLINGLFIETARQGLPEDSISIALQRHDGRAQQVLLASKLPTCMAGQTRLTRFQIPARLIAEGGHYFLSTKGSFTGGNSIVFGCFDINALIKTRIAALKDSYSVFRSNATVLLSEAEKQRRILGQAVLDRFIQRIENVRLSQEPRWALLQLDECERVLANLKAGSSRQDMPGDVSRPAPTTFRSGFVGWKQLQNDLELLPNMSANLIQQEMGPRSLSNDLEVLPLWKEFASVIDRAHALGIKTDLLLSPHYFPDWALEQAPDLKLNGATGFIKANIAHPLHRQVIEKWLRGIVPLVKEKPGLFSFCLSNEPTYGNSGKDAYSQVAWSRFLSERHLTIDALNSVYEANYESFDKVPVPAEKKDGSRGKKAAYYDWLRFNQTFFAEWHAWMNGIVKELAPEIPTHIKIMANIFDASTLARGVDPELMSVITDFAGNDCWSYPGRYQEYAYNWQLQGMWYDLLHSFKGQPVFNSENHLVPDNSPPESIAPEHTRCVLWHGALHHQKSSVTWVWSEPTHPDLVGNITLRPANLFSSGETMLDLQRLSREVEQISSQKAEIGLLYSLSSLFWQPDYVSVLRKAYAALTFSGHPVTFISENQLARGERSTANQYLKWIILPEASHVPAPALAGLESFTSNGGKVIAIGNSPLEFDEYGRGRTLPEMLDRSIRISPGISDKELQSHLVRILMEAGVESAELVDHATGKHPWGIEYRIARQEDGTLLVSLLNFLAKPQRIGLNKGKHARDLISGIQMDPRNLTLEPMSNLLLRIEE